jgi:DNA helicase-2/ATP-dependent DNA helicase PcrA
MDLIRLSQDQQRAVDSSDRALIVVAPAGSGKTEVLARRVERLLLGSDDDEDRVLALSYTVRAADELRTRLRSRLGDRARRVDADTVHGFALSLLRRHGSRIGLPDEPEILSTDADRVDLLLSWVEESGLDAPDDPAATLVEIDLARARGSRAPYLDEWRQALETRGALDFSAMVDRAIELMQNDWVSRYLQRLYAHVAVDEAQNLTRLQYQLLLAVIGPHPAQKVDATLVGDERQSIVRFAGADASLMSEFEREYHATRIELRTNFRSADVIVRAGRSVAARLGLPAPVDDWEYPAAGEIHIAAFTDEGAEGTAVAGWVAGLLERGLPAHAVAPGESQVVRSEDVAVLARAAGSLRFTRDALARLGIDSATSSSEAEWVRTEAGQVILALVAHLSAPSHESTRRRLARLCRADDDVDDVGRILAEASDPTIRALGALVDASSVEEFLDGVEQIDVAEDNWTNDLAQFTDAWGTFNDQFVQADRSFGNFNQHLVRCQRGDSLSPGVRLLTVHKAQGREFRAVALVGCNDGQLPDFRAKTPTEIHDELRVFYVALSRATRVVLLSRAASRETRYGSRTTARSPFLDYVAASSK